MFHERNTVYEFANLVKELETAGVLYSDKVRATRWLSAPGHPPTHAH